MLLAELDLWQHRPPLLCSAKSVPQTIDSVLMHPWHDVDLGSEAPHIVPVVIEVPKGSKTKYELDKKSGLLRVRSHPLQFRALPRELRLHPADLLRRSRPAR